MTANTQNLRVKGSSVNQHSVYAEREETLSEIDSKYQNGEYTLDQAREKALSIPECGREIILAVFAPQKVSKKAPVKKTKKAKARSVKANTQFNMGPRWAK